MRGAFVSIHVAGHLLIFNFSCLADQEKPKVAIDYRDILAALSMACVREECIGFALLIGTDFTQRPHQVGPAKALKHTHKYGSINRILEAEKEDRA